MNASNPIAEVERPENAYRELDHTWGAVLAKLTGGLSPAALSLAFHDWFVHLMASPGKRMELLGKAGLGQRQACESLLKDFFGALGAPQNGGDAASNEALHADHRLASQAWEAWPYRQLANNFLATEAWWNEATKAVPGVSRHHQDMVGFVVRQWLDMWSPSNSPLTNPEVMQRTVQSMGTNLLQGSLNAVEDTSRAMGGLPPVGVANYKPGENLAITPGKVVFRNHLMELIQYSPTTAKVHAEPLLIVPAWIMKYYILDLSPANSMVRYLVGQGHTVFCISWRNVTEEDRNLSFHDYENLGVMAALDTIQKIVPRQKVHAVGYCLGGTLLSVVAATLAGKGDERLATVTLFAAQTDFTEPGELALFIDDSQVNFLENMMWKQGYLAASQMSGAFQLLQSNDLIWSRMVHDYMQGERSPINDLMAWNADPTRMPYRMHSEYLRQLFLDNDLAAGRYQVDGETISIRNIRAPMFVVGTDRDHIAPWTSVYKIHNLSDTDICFVLANGGHNSGIVSEPGHPHRHYKLKHSAAEDLRVSPEEWQASAETHEGSWWEVWSQWLEKHSSTRLTVPPKTGIDGTTLGDAPGTYVLQK